MNLKEALAQKDKLFPMPRNGYLHMIAEERAKYIWTMRFLYDKGYELRRKGEKDKV